MTAPKQRLPQRALVPLIAAVVLAGAGYWWLTHETTPTLEPQLPNRTATEVTEADRPAAADSQPATNAAPQIDRDRVEARLDHLDEAQGVKGRILGPGGQPAAGVAVHLLESAVNDPIRVFLMKQSGKFLPPTSSGTTASDGTFALGLRTPGKLYDLRVTSDGHPELNHRAIEIRANDWFDTGDLTLEAGHAVHGRVIDATTKAGLANARVFLQTSDQAQAMLPTPGRERGILATTDQTGRFSFATAPGSGIINLRAEAPGYATATLNNQPLDAGNRHFTLELTLGRPIAGIVVDEQGEPLSRIEVTAQGMSLKTPQTAKTTSAPDGTFHFDSLCLGPYQLVTASATHAEQKSGPVLAGETDVKLVLIQRPWVKLKVLSARGVPLKAFRISLKRYFPNNPLGIGNVPEFVDRNITAADFPASLDGDWAVVRGLPAGTFVFQIRERAHAKSLSESFTVRPGAPPAEVSAQLTTGATITGTVTDQGGRPVEGATVTTDMNHAPAGDNDFLKMLRSLAPDRHSTARAKTDDQGRFRLRKLAFAEYMVRVSHPDYCEGTATDLVLEKQDQVTDVGTLQLVRGTLIEGFTTVAGRAAGQIKVMLRAQQPDTRPQAPHLESQQRAATFFASGLSDNDGRFRILSRVPPGTYTVHAIRGSGSANPFEAVLDIRATEKTITVSPNQDRLQIDFNLPTR